MEANYGILALIPPVVAIGLCFATKQVLISMFAGLFAGALVISNWNPFAAASYSLDALATNMADNVVLLLFTLFMGDWAAATLWQKQPKDASKKDAPYVWEPGALVWSAP